MSSAVMSVIVVRPATTEGASSFGTSFASRPMTRPSSASPVTRSDCGGRRISAPGPTMVVSGFMKLAGPSAGGLSERLPACSA